MKARIAVLGGDGIGPEVVAEATSANAARLFGDRLHLRIRAVSGAAVGQELSRLHWEARSVPASLEDVFILLSGQADG